MRGRSQRRWRRWQRRCRTGARLDFPTADFWYVRAGKIQEFNCHLGMAVLFAQLGALPDFASAVAASTPHGKAAGYDH